MALWLRSIHRAEFPPQRDTKLIALRILIRSFHYDDPNNNISYVFYLRQNSRLGQFLRPKLGSGLIEQLKRPVLPR
jgi:hypothetical protein